MTKLTTEVMNKVAEVNSLPVPELTILLGQDAAELLSEMYVRECNGNLVTFWRRLSGEEKRRVMFALNDANFDKHAPNQHIYLPYVFRCKESGALVWLSEEQGEKYPELELLTGELLDPWELTPDEQATVVNTELNAVATLWSIGSMFWLSIHGVDPDRKPYTQVKQTTLRSWWPVEHPGYMPVGERKNWLKGYAQPYFEKWQTTPLSRFKR